jgi:LemA protein
MKKSTIILIAVLGVFVVLIGMFFASYNSFVSAEENVNAKWSQVENQLQRRSDLIPNLVETVKGYAAHEQQIFTDVANARAKLAGSTTPQQQAAANDELSGALNRLLVVSERYPELKANENFRQLSDELAGTENRLAVARKDYNDTVAEYNKKVKRMPGAIIANISGFREKEYFKAAPGAEQPVKVDFGTKK